MKGSRLLPVIPQSPWISDVAHLYLLDTNILSNLDRQPQGVVAGRIANVGEANVLTRC